MAERQGPDRLDHRVRSGEELPSSMLAVATMVFLAVGVFAVAKLAPVISAALGGDSAVATVKFRSRTAGSDWTGGPSPEPIPYDAFAVIDASRSDEWWQELGLDEEQRQEHMGSGRLRAFAGVDRVKSFSRHIVVVGSNGEAKTRLAKSQYLICVVPSPDHWGGNFIDVCGEFDIAGDTTIGTGGGFGLRGIGMPNEG